MKTLTYRNSIFATIIGNCMEWFDYALIGYIAPRYLDIYPQEGASINPLFFIYGFALFGRPIGGLLFGYLGDILGRRLIMIMSIALMATGALLAAILPSLFYFSLLTPMLLLIILIIHNLSAGGETPASVTFLYESFPTHLRPFAISWVNFGFFLGVFLSTLDFSSLFWELKLEQFLDWGWRLPFLISAFLGFVGLSFRKKLHESPKFQEEKLHHHLARNPLKVLFKNYKKQFMLGACLFVIHSCLLNTFVIFGPTYFQTFLKRSADEVLTLSIFSMLVTMLSSTLGGVLSLKISSLKIIKVSLVTLILLAFPIYQLFQSSSIVALFFANSLLAILTGLITSLIPSLACGLFPVSIRCVGYSACRSIPLPFIDGMIPILFSWAIAFKGFVMIPAYAIVISAVISFVALAIVSNVKKEMFQEARADPLNT